MASSLPFPAELVPLVLQHFSQHELLLLCTLSRPLYPEMLRQLYRHVDLSRGDRKEVISWSTQIVQHPELAQHVRSLSLPMFITLDIIISPDSDFIKDEGQITETHNALRDAMHALSDLQTLAISEPSPSILTNRPHYDQVDEYLTADVFLGCNFRLRTFRFSNEAYCASISGMTQFFCEQRQLREWQIGIDFEIEGRLVSPEYLPHLSVVHMSYWTFEANIGSLRQPSRSNSAQCMQSLLRLVASRPITRLRLDAIGPCTPGDVLKAISTLMQHAEILTHLHITFEEISGSTDQEHASFLKTIAQILPNLKLLCYEDWFSAHVSRFIILYHASQLNFHRSKHGIGSNFLKHSRNSSILRSCASPQNWNIHRKKLRKYQAYQLGASVMLTAISPSGA